ncbi:unnamed protein product [Ilex paraguariensis]|uniref:KNOX1 domain-containing protein n=1 Tax=Ilex paraguariensis TaxID=185542 RepID=A0ABC8T4E4_9AQUA
MTWCCELYCTRFSIADLLLGAELRTMDEMYGLHSTAGYTAAQPPSPEYEAFESSSVPIFGSEHMLSANSAVSDTASMQRSVGGLEEESNTEAKRAKIASHPLYPKLLSAYIDCQKVQTFYADLLLAEGLLSLSLFLTVFFSIDKAMGCISYSWICDEAQ